MQTCVLMAFLVARFRGRVASLERRARGGGGASLGGGRRAAFGALSMDALSETMRARRGHRVIPHSTFLSQIAAAAEEKKDDPPPPRFEIKKWNAV